MAYSPKSAWRPGCPSPNPKGRIPLVGLAPELKALRAKTQQEIVKSICTVLSMPYGQLFELLATPEAVQEKQVAEVLVARLAAKAIELGDTQRFEALMAYVCPKPKAPVQQSEENEQDPARRALAQVPSEVLTEVLRRHMQGGNTEATPNTASADNPIFDAPEADSRAKAPGHHNSVFSRGGTEGITT